MEDKLTLPEYEDIYNEYLGLRENKSTNYVISLIRSIPVLQAKIYIISQLVSLISELHGAGKYSRTLIVELKKEGVKGNFPQDDAGQFAQDLRGAVSYSKRYITQIKKKEAEIEKYNKEHGAVKAQMKDFEVWAVTLSERNGYNITLDNTVVSRWCHLMNAYDRWAEVKHAETENYLKQKGKGYGGGQN